MSGTRELYAVALLSVLIGCGADGTNGGGGASTTSGTGGEATGGGGGANSGGGGATGGGGSAGAGATGGSGGQGGGGGNSCQWSPSANPCGNGMYCDAPGCGAGTCVALGTTDDPQKVAVCGCDNVSYWNEATAAQHGMSVAGNGPCSQPVFCGGIATLPCPMSQHYCSYALVNQQGCNISDPGGSCWGLPKTCPQIMIGGTWRRCIDGPGDPCYQECESIKLQQRVWPDQQGCPQ